MIKSWLRSSPEDSERSSGTSSAKAAFLTNFKNHLRSIRGYLSLISLFLNMLVVSQIQTLDWFLLDGESLCVAFVSHVVVFLEMRVE